jgi:ABC-type transport system substrate-binding protein
LDDYGTAPVTRRRILVGAAGAAVIVTLGAGCGDDDDQAAPGATLVPASSTSKPVPSELIVANEAEPDDLLPYFSGFGAGLVMRSLYETLVEVRMSLKADGSADVKYLPMLAESYQQTSPTTFQFKLRKGVVFHDGESWDAAAAKAAADVFLDAKLATSLKKNAILASVAKEARIVDPMTVEFTSLAPTNENEFLFGIRLGYSGVSPRLLRDKGLAGMLESVAGTGPFKLKSWTRGQEIRLERNAAHWNPEATNIPALTFITRKEASVRAQTIKSGEAHFAYNIGVEQASSLKKQVVGGGFQSSSLRLNNAKAPTNDVRVRRAVNLAIDRETINKSIFKGTSQPIGFFGFQPVKVEPFAFKPDEAKKLIEQAGVKGQELELVYGEGRIPEENQLVEIYKSELEAIGLKIKLTRLEPKQYNELGGKPFEEQPPLYMETTSSGNYGEIASGLRDKYGCKGTGTFCSPAFDAEFAKLATLSGAERQTALQSIANRLQSEETPRAWVMAVRQVHGLAENVVADLPLNAYVLLTDLKFS